MSRFPLRPVVLVLALSFGAVGLAQTPQADPKAVAVAEQVLTALGGQDTWQETRYIHFDYLRRGRTSAHTWDKLLHRYRRENTDGEGRTHVTMVDLNTKEGSAYVDGQALEGEELEKQLAGVARAWHGANYWALMPLKLLDSGVILGYDGEETIDGQAYDRIHLAFDNVGVTPDDQFWIFVNRTTHLIDKWRFQLGAGAEGEFRWKAWQEHGGLKIATIRERMDGSTEIALERIVVTNDLPESVFSSPESPELPDSRE